MQGMSENAQFSIAIAVGIFGILSIFVSLDTHNDDETVLGSFWKNALWTQPAWIQSTGIVLSVAYWALVLFGMQSYVSRRLFEALTGDYLKKMDEEGYYNNIKEIAKENKLAIGWSKLYGQVTMKEKIDIKGYTKSYFYI